MNTSQVLNLLLTPHISALYKIVCEMVKSEYNNLVKEFQYIKSFLPHEK